VSNELVFTAEEIAAPPAPATEQVFTDADIITNDGGQKVYNADKNLTYAYPSDHSEDQISFDQFTSVYGKPTDRFFGNVEMGWSINEEENLGTVVKNAVKGATSYFASLPQAVGGLIQE